jgi:hypothetical protein
LFLVAWRRSSWKRKIPFLGLEDFFAENGRFLRRDWTIPFPGLADSFPGTGKFHVAEKEFHSLTEVGGVSHSRLKFTASFLRDHPARLVVNLFFYWLSHFLLYEKSTKSFSSHPFNPFGRPRTVLQTQNV